MSVLQAALIALCYAFARSSFTFGLGEVVFSQPLAAGTIVGFLLGAPLEGAAIGGSINIATLGLSQWKVRGGPDVALIGYVGIPILLLNGVPAGDGDGAALIAALVGLGILLNFLRGLFNTVLAHWVDFFAGRGDAAVTAYSGVIPAQLWLFVTTFLPAFFLVRMAPAPLLTLAQSLPAWVQGALVLAQHLIGLLGIAVSLLALLKGSSSAYFFLGWLVASASVTAVAYPSLLTHSGAPILVTLIGVSIAVIHAYVARRSSSANPEMAAEQAADRAETKSELSISPLSRTDLGAAFVWWMFFHNAALNFERSQNMGFGGAMAMLVNRLYADAEGRAAALRRHLTLFASEPAFGAFAVGATAALEERRASGEPIGDAEFVGAKTSAMALLGTLGDAVITGILTTFLVAVGAALARQGNLFGPFLFAAALGAAFVLIAWGLFRAGYAQGRRWTDWARQNDWLPAALFGALRVGAFVLGALIVSVSRATPLPITPVVQIDAARIPLQNLVDGVLPGALPLLITLGMWYLMRYRKTQSMTLLGLCVLAAFIVAAFMRLVHWI